MVVLPSGELPTSQKTKRVPNKGRRLTTYLERIENIYFAGNCILSGASGLQHFGGSLGEGSQLFTDLSRDVISYIEIYLNHRLRRSIFPEIVIRY